MYSNVDTVTELSAMVYVILWQIMAMFYMEDKQL